MNSDIKFRAWDPEFKGMNYKVQVGNTDEADENYTSSSLLCPVDGTWKHFDSGNDVKVMQFTGAKDKRGTEIWEGDICESEGGLTDYWYVVEWIFGGWQTRTYKKPESKVYGISDGINKFYIDKYAAMDLTVVGNIYENPELLDIGV